MYIPSGFKEELSVSLYIQDSRVTEIDNICNLCYPNSWNYYGGLFMDPTFVAEIDLKLKDKLKKDLEEKGFLLDTPPYTFFSAKKQGISLTLYTSGKIVVQGKEKEDFILYYLEPEILQTFQVGNELAYLDMTPRIGVDEAGKGDFFGPLCVAAFYGEPKSIERLLEWGIKDSKKLSDKSIAKLAEKLKVFPHEIISLFPAKYNELYGEFRNLNSLLGWGHAKAIESLSIKTGCHTAIIDQFASEHVVLSALKRKKVEIDLTQKHKGESDPVVAAASILARDAFVRGMLRLEEIWKLPLPKGASEAVIRAGQKFTEVYGREKLSEVAKMHFRTVDMI